MSSALQKIEKHLHKLSVEIGPRPSGSPGNHAAAAYLKDVFREYGYQVEMQEYACPQWQELEVLLEQEGERLEAAANAYSPACDVTAVVVPACSLAELEAAPLEGRVGLLYGRLTQEPLSAKSWFLKTEHDDRVINILEQKKPAALLTVLSSPGALPRLIEDWEFHIPSAVIPAEVGMRLLEGRPEPVHLRIDSKQTPGSSCNLVARLPGSSGSRVVVCAHHDTKVDTPGALDNAAGVAVLLAIADQLSAPHFRSLLQHELEFVAFSGEEYLPLGDDEYLHRAGDSLEKIVAVLNYDGVGHILSTPSITLISGSDPLQQAIEEITRAHSSLVWVDPWPQSNHSTFTWRGVPGMAFKSEGCPPVAHTRADTFEGISTKSLLDVARASVQIVLMLQDQTAEWTRPSAPEPEAASV